MEFQTFDAAYVSRLKAGDPETESHFSVYFSKFLSLKLRARRISAGTADDVRQETLYRVLKTLRQGNGISQPERFGAFVNSVCNNVLAEFGRTAARSPDSDDKVDIADRRIAIDESLITAERRKMVAGVLTELSSKDREIIRLIFFEDADRSEICRRLGVEPDYLRVLLYRAKTRFQSSFVRRHGMFAGVLLLLCNGMAISVTIR